ncbi:MAG: GAF domain-containing protein, partial [Candidatus Entotheonellia bacterium]
GVDALDVWRHRRKDGALLAVEITSHPLQFDDRPARLVLAIDVTERQRAIQTLERQRQEAEILAELGRALNASLDLPTILQQVAEGARQLCGGDGAAIALREPDADAIVIRHWAGRPYRLFDGVRIERGQGIGGLVLATGRPLRTEDYAADPQLSKEHLSTVQAGRAVGVLAVPIRIEACVEGVIYVGSLHAHAFTDHDEALGLRLADLAAVAIRNAQLYQAQAQRRRAAEHLASTAQLLAQSLDPQEVAQRIVDSIRELLQARSATLFEVDPATGDFRVRTMAGDAGRAFAPRMLLPAGTGVAGLAIQERRPVVTANLLTDPQVVLFPQARARIARAPYRAVLAVPLLSHDQVTGALGVTDREGRRFTPEEIELVQSFAHQATTALNNASIYQKTQHAYQELTRTQEQLTQARKMEAVGRLAGGVAHDFNNLLTVITGRTQLLLMGLGPSDPARRDLELIQRAADRAASLTQQLLAFGRRQTLQPQVLDLNARVTNLSLMLRRLIGADITLVTTLDPTLRRVKVDPGQFDQVLLNLAVNARDAMPKGGRLSFDSAYVSLVDAGARKHRQVPTGSYVRL